MKNIRTLGVHLGNSVYKGKATNSGLMDTNTTNDQVKSKIEIAEDGVTITDIDGKPNLDVGVYYNRSTKMSYLRVENSDRGEGNYGGTHVSGVSLPLGHLNEKALQSIGDTNGGETNIEKVTLKKQGEGVLVEINPGSHGGAHNGYLLSRDGFAQVRGGPPMPASGFPFQR